MCAVLAKAWADCARTPALAERLASMTVVDATTARRPGAVPDAKQPVRDAIRIIDACLAAHPAQAGKVFARLQTRRTRFQAQVAATARAPRSFVLNTRARTLAPWAAPSAARRRRAAHRLATEDQRTATAGPGSRQSHQVGGVMPRARAARV